MAERIVKVKVGELSKGDIIAKDVYSSMGSVLVTKNTDINEGIIQKLLRNYNDYLYVYRKANEDFTLNININKIILDEVEDIIDTTSKKFLKQNKDINQIKKVLFEILNNDNAIKLLIPLRILGESVYNHSINVAVYAISVGKEMFMPYSRLKTLGTAALFHDIGMQKVSKDIIFKVDPLNEVEKKVVQMHPRFSFEMMQQTNKFNLEVCTIVLQHHERYDGNGYPNQIKNEKIHPMAKIISICDIFDALTNDRPYRQKFEKYESIEYLLSAGENVYSPEIVQGLINSISIYPFGKWVKLSTGEFGVIASQEEENSLNYRPLVMVYIDKYGNELTESRLVDLSMRGNSEISIEKLL